MYHAPSICLKSIDFHSLIKLFDGAQYKAGGQKQMKKHLAIEHRSSYLIQQCSISLNLLSKKERRALKFKIDFNMISDCFINSLGGKLFYLQKQKYMVSSHCTIIKFFNNANIIHFLTNSKFQSNYFTFYIHITLSAKTSQHHNKMQNKAYFRLIQAL